MKSVTANPTDIDTVNSTKGNVVHEKLMIEIRAFREDIGILQTCVAKILTILDGMKASGVLLSGS